eukprot:224151_1
MASVPSGYCIFKSSTETDPEMVFAVNEILDGGGNNFYLVNKQVMYDEVGATGDALTSNRKLITTDRLVGGQWEVVPFDDITWTTKNNGNEKGVFTGLLPSDGAEYYFADVTTNYNGHFALPPAFPFKYPNPDDNTEWLTNIGYTITAVDSCTRSGGVATSCTCDAADTSYAYNDYLWMDYFTDPMESQYTVLALVIVVLISFILGMLTCGVCKMITKKGCRGKNRKHKKYSSVDDDVESDISDTENDEDELKELQ